MPDLQMILWVTTTTVCRPNCCRLPTWIDASVIEVVVVTRVQVEAAREGFRRFGKGRHPAGLNFGDCFSYGLAKTLGETILFRGEDFSKTDLRAAISDG